MDHIITLFFFNEVVFSGILYVPKIILFSNENNTICIDMFADEKKNKLMSCINIIGGLDLL